MTPAASMALPARRRSARLSHSPNRCTASNARHVEVRTSKFEVVPMLLVLLAPFVMVIAQGRVASAADDPRSTLLVTQPMAPADSDDAAAGEASSQQPPGGAPRNEPRKRGDKLKLRWRSASLEYGKKLRIDFRTRLRAETRASDAAVTKEELDSLDIPRRRVGFDGEILKAVAFKVDYELDAINSAGAPTDRPWKDVYFDITQLEELQFRYGQFKMPFSLDETTGSQDLDFAYRSAAATLLAPSRARGGMGHGATRGRTVGYEYGGFRTDGSNAIVHTSEKRVNAGETTAWRITIEPLRGLSSPLADVHLGYARTGGDLPEGVSGIKGRTVLGADFYKPEFYVFGRRERRGFEFQWRPGPASLKMESITLTEERKGESVENTDLSPYEVRAWYVSGSYAFTGESKSRGLDRPLHPLFQGG